MDVNTLAKGTRKIIKVRTIVIKRMIIRVKIVKD